VSRVDGTTKLKRIGPLAHKEYAVRQNTFVYQHQNQKTGTRYRFSGFSGTGYRFTGCSGTRYRFTGCSDTRYRFLVRY
jgi:hypothetical protein